MSFSTLLAISFVVLLAGSVLFVIFGQVTMRKLRKNPETKHALGIEFVSGWDILNVAQALSLPKAILQRTRRNAESMGMSGFEADYEILYKHTTVFDRVLARVFYTLITLPVFAMFILIILDWFGVFD